MILLNFSHPLLADQIVQVVVLTDREVGQVQEELPRGLCEQVSWFAH